MAAGSGPPEQLQESRVQGQPVGAHPLWRTEIRCCNAYVGIARFLMEN